MQISRRDFLKAAAVFLTATQVAGLKKALAGYGLPPVIWLQGQGCTGCSVSFLNSVYYATVDELLTGVVDLKYHSTVMGVAGAPAVSPARLRSVSATEVSALSGEWLSEGDDLVFDLNKDGLVDMSDFAALQQQGYVLVVEGAIPFGADGRFCDAGGGMTMVEALRTFAGPANAVLAVGTCAAYGGISAGAPNPTGAVGVKSALGTLGINKTVIRIPGCPTHPDWIVGTVADLLAGKTPALDADGRPLSFFGATVHERCPNKARYDADFARRVDRHGEEVSVNGRSCLTCHANTDGHVKNPRQLGMTGCLYPLNCKGRVTHADCPVRKWNSAGKGEYGVNWCVGGRSPCHACTERSFPDGVSPFFTPNGPGADD